MLQIDPEDLTHEQLEIIKWTTTGSSIVSITATLIMLGVYLFLSNITSFHLRLIFWLNVADLFAASSSLVGFNSIRENDWRCQVSAAMQQFFFLASFFWIGCIGANMLLFQVHGKKNAWKYEIFYHLLSWGFPASSVIIILVLRGFGPAGAWCWVMSDFQSLRWVLFYGPMLLIVLFLLTVYIAVLLRIKIMTKEIPHFSSVKKQVVRSAVILLLETSFYVLGFILIRIPSIVNRFRELIYPNAPDIFIISLLHALASPFQGAINSILFFINKEVRNEITNFFRGIRFAEERPLLRQSKFTAAGYHQLPSIRKEQCSRTISIFVGTWNLGKAPPPDNLTPWIPNDFDIYAIGVQESSYRVSGKLEEKWEGSEQHLFSIIESHLGTEYTTVATVVLWEIRLIVLARKSIYESLITNVKTGKEATGIAHILGNKGGVGVAFSVAGTRLCFVNCHLAAHQSMVENRNLNAEEIFTGLQLGKKEKGTSNIKGMPPSWHFDLGNEFHHIFWFGDLNYRIDLPRPTVMQLIAEQDWLNLFLYDQLANQIDLGAVFFGFNESEIKFPPTYRYERGSRKYSDKKMRIPAWCDRVLWKSTAGGQIWPVTYSCCNEITTSDHSPVYSTFDVELLPSVDTWLDQSNDICSPFEIVILELRARNLLLGSPPPGTAMSITDSAKTLKSSNTPNYERRIDPCVYFFFPPFLAEPVCSSIAKNTNNPSWTSNDIPKLGPFQLGSCLTVYKDSHGNYYCDCANTEAKRRARSLNIFISVRDFRLWGRSEVESLGQCVIPLTMGLGEIPRSFVYPLTHQGREAGEIAGRIHIRPCDPNTAASAPLIPSVFVRDPQPADIALSFSL